jgi:hypothetical protein
VVSLAANKLGVKAEAGKSGRSTRIARRSLTFTVTDGAKITRNGQPAALKDIKPGDSVAVSFDCKKGCASRKVKEVTVTAGSSAQ